MTKKKKNTLGDKMERISSRNGKIIKNASKLFDENQISYLCNTCKKSNPYALMFEEGLCMDCYQKNPKRAKNLDIKKEIKNLDLFEEEQNIFEDLIDVLQELGINITFKNIKIINRFIVRTLKRFK